MSARKGAVEVGMKKAAKTQVNLKDLEYRTTV